MTPCAIEQPEATGTGEGALTNNGQHSELQGTKMNDTDTLEPLLTIDEVSAYMQTPKKTLYTWRSAGRGPRCMKFGGNLRYRRSDVDAWLNDQYEDVA